MKTLDHDLDQRLRRTLAAVAATVDEESVPVAKPRRRRRRLAIAAGVTLAAVPLAAGAWVQFGPEYVDRIPPANPIISGTLDGERYWVVDGREVPRCEGAPSGIEVIAEENNVVGQEWDSVGYFFGEPTADGCARRAAANPPEDTYYSDGGQEIGDGMLWMGALHPEIDQVRATLGGGESFDVETFEHEGHEFYLLEVPPDTAAFTVEYLIDGELVSPPPGETSEHTMGRD